MEKSAQSFRKRALEMIDEMKEEAKGFRAPTHF